MSGISRSTLDSSNAAASLNATTEAAGLPPSSRLNRRVVRSHRECRVGSSSGQLPIKRSMAGPGTFRPPAESEFQVSRSDPELRNEPYSRRAEGRLRSSHARADRACLPSADKGCPDSARLALWPTSDAVFPTISTDLRTDSCVGPSRTKSSRDIPLAKDTASRAASSIASMHAAPLCGMDHPRGLQDRLSANVVAALLDSRAADQIDPTREQVGQFPLHCGDAEQAGCPL